MPRSSSSDVGLFLGLSLCLCVCLSSDVDLLPGLSLAFVSVLWCRSVAWSVSCVCVCLSSEVICCLVCLLRLCLSVLWCRSVAWSVSCICVCLSSDVDLLPGLSLAFVSVCPLRLSVAWSVSLPLCLPSDDDLLPGLAFVSVSPLMSICCLVCFLRLCLSSSYVNLKPGQPHVCQLVGLSGLCQSPGSDRLVCDHVCIFLFPALWAVSKLWGNLQRDRRWKVSSEFYSVSDTTLLPSVSTIALGMSCLMIQTLSVIFLCLDQKVL